MFFFSEGIPTERLVFGKTFISSPNAVYVCFIYLQIYVTKYPNVGFFFHGFYTIHDVHGCYGSHKSVA